MKNTLRFIMLGILILQGCATTDGQKPEEGPHGTIAYLVEIDSSEPGARVEANNEQVGKTPFTLKIFGDKRGRFHNFGNPRYTLIAYPVRAGQQPQTKVFLTGGFFSPVDNIPKKLFFDFGPVPEASKTEGK